MRQGEREREGESVCERVREKLLWGGEEEVGMRWGRDSQVGHGEGPRQTWAGGGWAWAGARGRMGVLGASRRPTWGLPSLTLLTDVAAHARAGNAGADGEGRSLRVGVGSTGTLQRPRGLAELPVFHRGTLELWAVLGHAFRAGRGVLHLAALQLEAADAVPGWVGRRWGCGTRRRRRRRREGLALEGRRRKDVRVFDAEYPVEERPDLRVIGRPTCATGGQSCQRRASGRGNGPESMVLGIVLVHMPWVGCLPPLNHAQSKSRSNIDGGIACSVGGCVDEPKSGTRAGRGV